MKALCFGSMNLDYVYSVSHIVTPGETLCAGKRELFVGGKGLNQAVAMAKAGLKVRHAGISGRGGEVLLETLEENGVNVSLIRKVDAELGHTIIQVDERGQNSILLFGGTNRMITSDYIETVINSFEEGDLILLQNEINRLNEIINAAAAKGMRIALNPSPYDKAIDSCDLNKVTLFLVNEVEGAQISGRSAEEPQKILDWFWEQHPQSAVVLTLGSEGAWYSDVNSRFFQPAFPVKAVDTTAAGDTFSGYFLEGWMTGRPIEESLRRAAKAASIAVTRKGAAPSIPLPTEVDE